MNRPLNGVGVQMGFFDLVKRALGKGDDGSQAARDEQIACLYEACSAGNLPIISDPPVILKRGETAHFVSPVSVIEQKTETTTYRAYTGTRLKIGSLPIYLGGSAPKKVSQEALTPMGDGWLVITNRRIVVSGTKINYSTSLDKITNWKLFTDAIQIMWEGRYGGRFYKVNDPRVPALILQALITGIPEQPQDVEPDPDYFIGAAYEGRADIVEDILNRGFDPNVTTQDGRHTALIAAALQGHVEVLELLLERGAAINKKNRDDLTALMMAASEGRADAVKFLAERSGEVNVKTKDGFTPLMIAALNGQYEIVEILLRAGAKPNAKNKDGESALGAALYGEHPEVAELLRAYGAKG
jgi:hypothetical protein